MTEIKSCIHSVWMPPMSSAKLAYISVPWLSCWLCWLPQVVHHRYLQCVIWWSEWKLLHRGRITYRHCRQPKTTKLSLLVKHHILAIDEASYQQQQQQCVIRWCRLEPSNPLQYSWCHLFASCIRNSTTNIFSLHSSRPILDIRNCFVYLHLTCPGFLCWCMVINQSSIIIAMLKC